MPRYAYQKPVNRQYAYNTRYMNNYYKPLTDYIEKKKETQVTEKAKRAPSEQPGHQSLAELRLRDPIWYGYPWFWDWDCVWVPPHENRSRPHFGVGTNVKLIREFLRDAAVLRVDDEPRRVPLWMKHPYRLPVEDIRVPPHESSIWPESVPHFNLVSSYDVMVGYLGLKHPQR